MIVNVVGLVLAVGLLVFLLVALVTITVDILFLLPQPIQLFQFRIELLHELAFLLQVGLDLLFLRQLGADGRALFLESEEEGSGVFEVDAYAVALVLGVAEFGVWVGGEEGLV